MEMIKAVKFKYQGDFSELFKDFKEMIEFCINKGLKLGITSYSALLKPYCEFVANTIISNIVP